jgi:hypothetical protein
MPAFLQSKNIRFLIFIAVFLLPLFQWVSSPADIFIDPFINFPYHLLLRADEQDACKCCSPHRAEIPFDLYEVSHR